MQQEFKVASLLQQMGEQVAKQFEEAGLGTTGTIVGDAREKAIRNKLQEVLSGSNRVTRGVIIDSYQNVSQQTDIIVHEADICPVFRVGGSEGEEYIPCEGVWAAGEVKSRLRREDIRSICAHSMSVRSLRRYARRRKDILSGGETVSYRSYGVGTAFQGTKEEEYDQGKKESDRIFTFGVVGKWDLSSSECAAELKAFIRQHGLEMAPNIIIGIEKGMLLPAAKNERGAWSPEADWGKAQGIAVSDNIEDRWRKLVGILNLARADRRTVEIRAFNQYTSLWGGIRPFSSGIENQEIGEFTFTAFE